MSANELHKKVNAQPTKALFISTLIRDVDLDAAILDLVDNSIDGARSQRPDGNYSGLYVEITIRPELFRVKDNCGGISLQVAEDYAFRFGRPEDSHGVSRSIGQFGVGMKRTLFKMAEHFTVKSTTTRTSFVVDVDVAEWKQNADEWSFPLSDVTDDGEFPSDQIGTDVLVDRLKPEYRTELSASDTIPNKIREHLRIAHQDAIRKGLEIRFNGQSLKSLPLFVLHSDDLKPARREFTYPVGAESVSVTIIVGVGGQDSDLYGWYVFCNGRLLLHADQTARTGWIGRVGGHGLPKAHQQFNRFRGFVYFEADNGALLPWNTTKTGITLDHDLYKKVLQNMVSMAKPVLEFLNDVRDEERAKKSAKDDNGEEPSTPLLDILSATSPHELTGEDSKPEVFLKKFKPPTTKRPVNKPASKTISFQVPMKDFERALEIAEVTSASELGRHIFNYFMDIEG